MLFYYLGLILILNLNGLVETGPELHHRDPTFVMVSYTKTLHWVLIVAYFGSVVVVVVGSVVVVGNVDDVVVEVVEVLLSSVSSSSSSSTFSNSFSSSSISVSGLRMMSLPMRPLSIWSNSLSRSISPVTPVFKVHLTEQLMIHRYVTNKVTRYLVLVLVWRYLPRGAYLTIKSIFHKALNLF